MYFNQSIQCIVELLYIVRHAGVYARVTAVMDWIVEKIQDGECHYVQKYIDDVIENKRKRESSKTKKLKDMLNEIKRKNEKDYKRPERDSSEKKWPCKCPKCHKNVYPRIPKYRENECMDKPGIYMTGYKKEVKKYCRKNHMK